MQLQAEEASAPAGRRHDPAALDGRAGGGARRNVVEPDGGRVREARVAVAVAAGHFYFFIFRGCWVEGVTGADAACRCLVAGAAPGRNDGLWALLCGSLRV